MPRYTPQTVCEQVQQGTIYGKQGRHFLTHNALVTLTQAPGRHKVA